MLDNIEIILLNTSHPGNIGSTARAMKNMGLTKLKLVNPKYLPNDESIALAANATDILENIQLFDKLEDAIASCTKVYGTSGRDFKLKIPKIDARSAAQDIVIKKFKQVGILFGAERTGLTKEELIHCDSQIFINANFEYCSLNLAQAVQIVGYELYYANTVNNFAADKFNSNNNLPNKAAINYFYKSLEQLLVNKSILDPKDPGNLISRIRQIFTRANLDEKELNILQSIVSNLNNESNL